MANFFLNYVVDDEQTTQAAVSSSTGVNIGVIVMSVTAVVIVLTLMVFILTLLVTRHRKSRLIEIFYSRFHYRIGYLISCVDSKICSVKKFCQS